MDTSADQTRSARANAWASTLRERRANSRFPFEQELVFHRDDVPGEALPFPGKTLNMSSGGILFETDSRLAPGEVLRMAIRWPARLENRCAMKIVVVGRVVRCFEGHAAVEILQHSFKIAGKNGLSL